MLLSLLVYTITGAVLFYLGWHVNAREQRQLLNDGSQLPFYSWEIIASILLFSVIAGARYHTGYDHAMYLDQYLTLQRTGEFQRTNFEPGFVWISKAFAACNIHYFFYFAFWAMLQIGFVYFGLRKRKFLLPWVGLYIMLNIWFYYFMNTMRQGVVTGLLVCLIPLIREKKFLPYLLIVMTASLIHKSALLLALLVFLPYIPQRLKSLKPHWLLAIFAVFILFGIYPVWTKAALLFPDVLNKLGYGYLESTKKMVNEGFRIVNFGPSRMCMLTLNIITVSYYHKVKQHFSNDVLYPYYFCMAFIGMCLFNLLINTTHFMLRPVEFFTFFSIITVPYLLHYLYEKKQYLMLAFVSVLAFSDAFFSIYKACYIPTRTSIPYLYHTFFLPSL